MQVRDTVPIFWVTKSFLSQNPSKIRHMCGSVPQPSSVIKRRPRSKFSYDFQRSKNNSKGGYWSMLASFWDILSSRMSIPIPITTQQPWRTSWKAMHTFRRVSMKSSTTFQRYLARRSPKYQCLPLGRELELSIPAPLVSPHTSTCITSVQSSSYISLGLVGWMYPLLGMLISATSWSALLWGACGRLPCSGLSGGLPPRPLPPPQPP